MVRPQSRPCTSTNRVNSSRFGPGSLFLSTSVARLTLRSTKRPALIQHSERQLNAGWKQFIGVLSHDSRTWWNYVRLSVHAPRATWPLRWQFLANMQFLNSYGRMCEFAYAPGAKQAGWHLQLIGVLRSHRQQGIASLLINGVKVLAAQKKLSMFVECVRGKVSLHVHLT
jgi:GNAT superfamily N-acetyltransferase